MASLLMLIAQAEREREREAGSSSTRNVEREGAVAVAAGSTWYSIMQQGEADERERERPCRRADATAVRPHAATPPRWPRIIKRARREASIPQHSGGRFLTFYGRRPTLQPCLYGSPARACLTRPKPIL